MTGEKQGTLLQGNGPRADSWHFHHLYEEVARKRDREDELAVEECMQEANDIDLEVDTSIPPPTPPPRGPDGEARSAAAAGGQRPMTSGPMQSRPTPPKFNRSSTSLS